MKDISLTYLFNVHTEGHILIKNDFHVLRSVAGGQSNAIQRKTFKIFRDKYNIHSFVWI